MHINKEQKPLSILLLELFGKIPHSNDLWKHEIRLLAINSVQVFACEARSGIADNDPIWIDHGNYFENNVVPQQLCFGTVL